MTQLRHTYMCLNHKTGKELKKIMSFESFRDKLKKHFENMCNNTRHLFTVNVDKDKLYELYLDSFPVGTNEIYRERRKHDCNNCKHFIRNIGNVVAINNGVITTIWSFDPENDTYAPVVKAMDEYVRAAVIDNVFLSRERIIGNYKTFEIKDEETRAWQHLAVTLDPNFVINDACAIATKQSEYRAAHDVFKRALDEITADAIDVVMDLIMSNTLYKGAEYRSMVESLQKNKREYDKLDNDSAKDIFAWEHSVKIGNVAARIRNHAIGTLLSDISDGKDLETAVKAYEKITAPANYKRSKPVFTQRMLDEAQKTVENLGYADALPRRHATADDITVNDILFVDRSVTSRVQGASGIFGELSGMAKNSRDAKKFDRVEEISIENFLVNVLPAATKIEVFVANRLVPNLVSLIAPVNSGVKSMFKWGNNFTWAYKGNITDSMKERVKSFGGSVDGDVRFSIQWNEDGTDNCDLDAHCKEPNFEIFFSTAKKPRFSPTKGQLDVDIIQPNGKVAVENITWKNKHTMTPGTYTFFVHQYSGSAKNGFRAELEVEGELYEFDYPHGIRTNEKVQVAAITIAADHTITVKPLIDTTAGSKKVWNIATETFVPVTVICNSPNYWETAASNTGHKHVFFMLKDCINDENPSGIFNEFLVPELYEHRRVMEAIGNRMRVADSTDQLSGLGFALDKRNELIVRVTGATERIMKIKF